MVTPTVAAPVVRRRRLGRLVLRAVLILLALGFLVVAGIFAWFYRIAHASLPQLDGSIAVPGLQAAVDVVRDTHGVPHIAASNLEDLFFAQGYITAQDRLWQMDMTRRFAAGELSEILGPEMIRHDREQRILMLPAV